MQGGGPEEVERRLALAEALLQEAVYRSRGEQAGAAVWDPAGRTTPPGAGGAARCGLGARAAIVLDLTPRAEELFAALSPTPPAQDTLPRIQAVLRAWIERQDAFDRRRNHFLKDFRQRHGFDRASYSDDERARFEAGLERVNGDASEARRSAAAQLLAALSGSASDA